MSPWPAVAARRIAFRFGLTGRRWGDEGPVVLMVHDRAALPAHLAQLIHPLVASGRQVIELDDPTDAADREPARSTQLASAIAEAAVELRGLETIVADGVGAAAAEQAQDTVWVPVLEVRDGATSDDILDFLLDREVSPLAA